MMITVKIRSRTRCALPIALCPLLLAFCALALAGCGLPEPPGSSAPPRDVAALADSATGVPDLSREVSPAEWMTGAGEPLEVARAVARSVGGNWIAVAPDPDAAVRLR